MFLLCSAQNCPPPVRHARQLGSCSYSAMPRTALPQFDTLDSYDHVLTLQCPELPSPSSPHKTAVIMFLLCSAQNCPPPVRHARQLGSCSYSAVPRTALPAGRRRRLGGRQHTESQGREETASATAPPTPAAPPTLPASPALPWTARPSVWKENIKLILCGRQLLPLCTIECTALTSMPRLNWQAFDLTTMWYTLLTGRMHDDFDQVWFRIQMKAVSLLV